MDAELYENFSKLENALFDVTNSMKANSNLNDAAGKLVMASRNLMEIEQLRTKEAKALCFRMARKLMLSAVADMEAAEKVQMEHVLTVDKE